LRLLEECGRRGSRHASTKTTALQLAEQFVRVDASICDSLFLEIFLSQCLLVKNLRIIKIRQRLAVSIFYFNLTNSGKTLQFKQLKIRWQKIESIGPSL
jgi:hypothetical protein